MKGESRTSEFAGATCRPGRTMPSVAEMERKRCRCSPISAATRTGFCLAGCGRKTRHAHVMCRACVLAGAPVAREVFEAMTPEERRRELLILAHAARVEAEEARLAAGALRLTDEDRRELETAYQQRKQRRRRELERQRREEEERRRQAGKKRYPVPAALFAMVRQ